MYAVRYWSVRHARPLKRFYQLFMRTLIAARGLWRWLGYARAEGPVSVVEHKVKGLLFDCQMCGQCVLSDTGLSCPMNCPKSIRNGPCGGVRPNGHCEVKPEMRCVWMQAWRGAQKTDAVEALTKIQPAVDNRLRGQSSWLAEVKANDPKQAAQSAGESL